jgi:nucleoside-diphosphate-sugar epimerase
VRVLDDLSLGKRERPRVILCGSGDVYGNQPAFVLNEELPLRPSTPAAVTQLAVEQYGRVYRENYGVPVAMLRIFRTFGPDEDPHHPDAGVVARFVRSALEGASPVILGDGQQTRDLVYIDNVVAAILACLRVEPKLDVVNIASGEAVSINHIWRLVLELVGRQRLSIEPTYVPAPPWEPMHARPQIKQAARLLGWAPTVRLREGLARTVYHSQAVRDADPNAWFSPKEDSTPRARSRPPLMPPRASNHPRATKEEVFEVSDKDLIEDPTEPRALDKRDLDVAWAPVPPVPGLTGNR